MGFTDMNVIMTLFCRNAFVNNMQKKSTWHTKIDFDGKVLWCH